MPSEFTCFAGDETGLERELVLRAAHGLARDRLVDAGELEEHATGLDVGDPPLRGALARTHAGLGGLLGQRAVGVDVDPHLAAALDVTGHGDTSRLDLSVGHVGPLERLDPEVTEGQAGAALGRTTAVGVVLLAVLETPGHQHGQASVPDSAGAAAGAAAVASAGAASGAEPARSPRV